MSPRASAPPATSATTRWRPSPSSRCGCSGRCCSRASRAPARPRSPRRSPRRSTCRWSGCSATRASTPPRRSTTGTSRARSCTCARSRRPAPARDVEEAEKSLYDERFLLARPVLAGAPAEPGGAAGRRGRPGRRRVRGVPARGAVDLPGDDPRARHRRAPRRRRSWCSPPTAPASCTTRSSGAASTTGSTTPASSARSRSSASRAPEVSEDAGPAGRRRRPAAARPRRPAQAARGRRDPRLGARAAPPRHRRARPRVVGAATLGALVKYREDADRVRQALDRMLRAMTRATDAVRRAPTRSCSASPARCAPPGCRSPRTARTASSPRSRWSGSTTSARRTSPAGPRCAPAPDDLARYDQVFEAYFNARDGLPRAAAGAAARADVLRACR